jgi:hypothetical protein
VRVIQDAPGLVEPVEQPGRLTPFFPDDSLSGREGPRPLGQMLGTQQVPLKGPGDDLLGARAASEDAREERRRG